MRIDSLYVLYFQGSMIFGTPGLGGQMVFGDLEHKLGLAFLTNRLEKGFRSHIPPYKDLLAATYDVVKNIKK